MSFCPECKYEYVEGIYECPDCRVKLVRSLEDIPEETASVEESPTGKLFCCWDSTEFFEANAACSVLRGENIPCYVERSQRPMYSAYTRDENYPSSYYVMVPEAQAYEARQILEIVMPSLELTSSDDVGEPVDEEFDEDHDEDYDEE